MYTDDAFLQRHYVKWLNNPDKMVSAAFTEITLMLSRGHITIEQADLLIARANLMAEHCKRINNGESMPDAQKWLKEQARNLGL